MSGFAEFLFVYGTLRKGSNNPLARRLFKEADYQDEAMMRGRLYDLGGYPGAVDSSALHELVWGDLFRLPRPGPLLKALDEYEGCGENIPAPGEFRRELRLVSAWAQMRWAWVYLYDGDLAGRRRIMNGKFGAARGAKRLEQSR